MSSITKIQKFLQKCYDEWLEHIQLKRGEFPLLNYFTLNQLVVLRTELSQINNKRLVNEKTNMRALYDLLFNINNDLSIDMIKAADVYACDKTSELKLKINSSNIRNDVISKEQKKELIEDLEMQGFERSLIEKAIRILKTHDRQQLMQFCVDNEEVEFDSVSQNDTILTAQDEIIFEKLSSSKYNVDSLEAKFENISERFKDMLEKNYSDFLSLDHVGYLLESLKSKSKRIIIRKIPPFLEAGVPNLILIENADLIARVLSIYMYSVDQPLPNDDEILLCTEKTSVSEVEIYLKRALVGCIKEDIIENRKIYCMVNASDLPFDTAVKILQIYENLPKRDDFAFCIVCAEEKEAQSVFATAYNRYKKKLPQDIDYKKIQDYLYEHFKLPKNGSNISAASIEDDRLTARIIKSERSGVGKSLYIERSYEEIERMANKNTEKLCIPVKKQILCIEDIIEMMKNFDKNHFMKPRLFHIDIAYEVLENVNSFLFQLLCMSVIKNERDEIWRRSTNDLYLIEIMSMTQTKKNDQNRDKNKPLHSILMYLPTIHCLTPRQIFKRLKGENEELNFLKVSDEFDKKILQSENIQRPCQYLRALDEEESLNEFKFDSKIKLSEIDCLELLLNHSEMENPSFSELMNFCNFLNIQLADSEKSVFCHQNDILPGFREFVIKFVIQMSHDFALPSLCVSDVSAILLNENNQVQFKLDQVQMKRKWETNPHPYLFFNPDHCTFTFFGFYVNYFGKLADPINHDQIVFPNIRISKDLMSGINRQAKNILQEKVTEMTKLQNIEKILYVMGKSWSMKKTEDETTYDPDPTYELTMDNVLKIMAIYMRFRCNIPVIVMGETGCGKTRLIKYLCDLQKPPDNPNKPKAPEINNMCLVKVHGGISSQDIIDHVRKAQRLAARNKELFIKYIEDLKEMEKRERRKRGIQVEEGERDDGTEEEKEERRKETEREREIFTILFFDEANSTEAIGTIKEILCDGRMNGEKIDFSNGLKIIAACNPYKKHPEEVIKNFEKAGLGFYASETSAAQEKLGNNLSMRDLVYRVQPLPTSMLPMIWDFGQLNDTVEKLYITQIVESHYNNQESRLHLIEKKQLEIIIDVLTESQKFMREQKNECSFVSLRDIQRVLVVVQWFMKLDKFLKK